MTPTNRKPRVLVLDRLREASAAITQAGGRPVTFNPREVATVDAIVAGGYDALLLTGGGDVNPRLYGEKPHRRVYGVNDVRDMVEMTALQVAADNDIPVLGICRGMQMIAVHNGGRLKQHIEGHRGGSHTVYAQPRSLFRRALGHDIGFFVSLHHQVVLRTGRGFRVAARDVTGQIEGIESLDGRVLGVQFHPEMDHWRNPQSRELFRWLTREAAQRAGLVRPRSQQAPKVRPFATGKQGSRRSQLSLLPDERPRLDTASGVVKRKPRKPVASRWFCRGCGLEFDKRQDRDDHEYWVCGTPQLRVSEPPPGHPDWMPEDAA